MGRIHIKEFLTEYIEKDTNPKDLWTMSRKEIIELTHNKFKKEGYSEKEIEEILGELLYEEDKHIKEDEVSFNIIYPKNKKEAVKEVWAGRALLPYKKATLIAISLVILLGGVYLIKPDFIGTAFLFPVLLYFVYYIIDTTYKNFEKNFKILNKDKNKLVLIYISGIIIVLVGILFFNYFQITSFNMNEIIVYTFGGGLTLGMVINNYLKLKN
jgi:hypothetical protein